MKNILERLGEPSSWAGIGLGGIGVTDLVTWWWSYSETLGNVASDAAQAVQGGSIVNGGLLLLAGLLSVVMKERGLVNRAP